MSEWKQKRFWKTVSADPVEGGYAVHLDGRAVKTPAKAPLHVPTAALAKSIAAEWNAQEDVVNPTSMPVTRSANAAIDKLSLHRTEVIDMLAAYGDSDLTCYRADAPLELVARQTAGWDPVLDWLESRFGARLVPQAGVMHVPQDPAALEPLHGAVAQFGNFELAALHDLVTLSGSLALALAVTDRHFTAGEAWDLSRIDEFWQAEQWGEDEEAQEVAALKRAAFLHAEAFFLMARDDSAV